MESGEKRAFAGQALAHIMFEVNNAPTQKLGLGH